jgi:hypothetical protein
VLAGRWGPHFTSVVALAQTAFLSGSCIGDNAMGHLEELDFLESAREPGTVAFLDFSKAYHRLYSIWVH